MRIVAIAFLWLTLLAGAARAQEAGTAPADLLPMLDTGGHTSGINSIAFTPDGRQLVSASDDKTIRVWDVATGKTLRTFRGQTAPGHRGKVYATALSADGKWLAAGGWLAAPDTPGSVIRLYDFASGKLVALFKGHEDAVRGVAFSPDGRYLISGSQDKTAMIWDAGSWSGSGTGSPRGASRTAAKPQQRLEGHRGAIYAVSFTPDGAHAVTGSFDRELRLWRAADGALLQIMTGHEDKVVNLAHAPDGRIASGDGSGEIRLWDGQTGTFLKTLALQNAMVGSLSFTPDGKLLLSCFVEPSLECHVYDAASGAKLVTYRWHAALASAVSPDGRWAAAGGGDHHEIHIWDLRTGARRQGLDGQPLTLGGTGRSVRAVGFSTDGRQIGWGDLMGSLQYALTLPAADGALSGPRGLSILKASRTFRRAETIHGGWSLSHGKTGNYGNTILDISEGGKVRASIGRGPAAFDESGAYSFTPDGETIVSGGSQGVLAAYDRDGKKLGAFIGHDDDIYAVAPSPDGRYLLSGSADQTLRLWNLKTREPLVTLFRGTDGEWVMWTPQGYYASSPAGARLIGVQIGRGPEHEARYANASRFRQLMNRPDIVARAIQLVSAEAAAKEALDAHLKLHRLPD